GKCSAVQLHQVGSGSVSDGNVSAVSCRHDGSLFSSLTAPDMNINRNSNQRHSQSTVTDGGGSSDNFGSHWRGARKTASQPVSNSSVSHWKPRKSPQIVERER